MTFATPVPDMSNREICRYEPARGQRSGRPKRSDKDRIQAIAWFHFVRISLGCETAGAVATRVQAHCDGLGMVTNHEVSKRWYRYRKGLETPNAQTLHCVDLITPGSADFFRVGPFDLWAAMWSKRYHNWYDDFAEMLLSVASQEMNFDWLIRVLATWSKRAELAKGGTATGLVDGFYEVLHLGFHLPNIKEPLEELGVWSDLLKILINRESENLRYDGEKACEIRAVGSIFGLRAPVDSYLNDPVGFFQATFAVSQSE